MSADSIIWGMALMHLSYGLLFVAIAPKRPGPPLWHGMLCILLWPVMVHYLMDRAEKYALGDGE